MPGRRRVSWRLFLLASLFAAGSVGLVARLVYLPILNHDGYPLATTVDAFDVLIERKAWRGQSEVSQWAETMAPLTGHTPQEIIEGVQAESKGDYLLALAVDYDVGQRLAAMGIPGLKTAPTGKRFYPEGDLASALLGFVGRGEVGLAGLEL